jgi:hypothetical protein
LVKLDNTLGSSIGDSSGWASATVGEDGDDDESGGDTDDNPSVSVVRRLSGDKGEAMGLNGIRSCPWERLLGETTLFTLKYVG